MPILLVPQTGRHMQRMAIRGTIGDDHLTPGTVDGQGVRLYQTLARGVVGVKQGVAGRRAHDEGERVAGCIVVRVGNQTSVFGVERAIVGADDADALHRSQRIGGAGGGVLFPLKILFRHTHLQGVFAHRPLRSGRQLEGAAGGLRAAVQGLAVGIAHGVAQQQTFVGQLTRLGVQRDGHGVRVDVVA